MTDRTVIIGAGVGGLASAIRLAANGFDVTVLERASSPGGKLREIAVGGNKIDGGPTVFTMRWVFEELFAAAGEQLEKHLSLEKADILARHAWSASERLDLFADIERSADAIAAFSSPAEERRYRRFCAHTKDIYETMREPFLSSQKPSGSLDMTKRVGLSGVPALMRAKPFSGMWASLTQQLKDPRLLQLFGRYATYCGSSPYQAPATLSLIAHVEQEGVWLVKGGMYRLIEALSTVATKLGVEIKTDTHVDEILVNRGCVQGVLTDHETTIPAKAVIANSDANALYSGLLGQKLAVSNLATQLRERSLSALVWTANAKADGFPLTHHTVFFSRNYKDEFRRIFEQGQLPQEPTVYICAQNRRAGMGHVPNSAEPMLILVNAPANGDQTGLSAEDIAACQDRMISQLDRCGLSLQLDPQSTVLTTPADFAKLFPATGGALYGKATHGWDASFRRPSNRTALPGLYLAGGSVHPGPGVPMAALSGRLAAEALMEDRASTRRSYQAATSGGM